MQNHVILRNSYTFFCEIGIFFFFVTLMRKKGEAGNNFIIWRLLLFLIV